MCIIKDCVLSDGVPDVIVMPGEGLVDFHAVLSALIGKGFDGPLYVECVGGQELVDIDARALRARLFVERVLGGID